MSAVTITFLSLWWLVIAVSGTSFTAPVNYKQAGRHASIPREYLRVARKYNVDLPGFESHLDITTVPAVNQSWDKEYLSPIRIGTPGQDVWMDFDTGSADTFVSFPNTYAV
jgi:aspergillopepsin I